MLSAADRRTIHMITTTLTLLLAAPQGPQFEAPVRLHAGDHPIKVEAPGYAAPSLFDVDRDGTPDLVVGQFAGGKMQVFKGLGKGRYAAGSWLMAEGDVAEVPGVW